MQKELHNKEFLEFLYILTQTKKCLSFAGMANIRLSSGKRMTKPTIKRWFREMGKKGFYYHPLARYENFSIIPVSLIYQANQQLQEENDATKRVSSHALRKSHNGRSYFLDQFLIPEEEYEIWKKGVTKRNPSSCVITTKSEYVLYNTFHMMFTDKGEFKTRHGEFSEQSLRALEHFLTKEKPVTNNEILKYILLDKIKSWKNSHNVWYSLKEKGVDLWKHIKKRKKEDPVGIKYIQEILRKQEFELGHKLFYEPLFKDMKQMFLVGELTNAEIIALAKALEKECIYLSIFKGEVTIISTHTTINGLQKILSFLDTFEKEADIYLEKMKEVTNVQP